MGNTVWIHYLYIYIFFLLSRLLFIFGYCRSYLVHMAPCVDIHFKLRPFDKVLEPGVCVSFLPILLTFLVEWFCCGKRFDCTFCTGCLIREVSLVSRSSYNLAWYHEERMGPEAQERRNEL